MAKTKSKTTRRYTAAKRRAILTYGKTHGAYAAIEKYGVSATTYYLWARGTRRTKRANGATKHVANGDAAAASAIKAKVGPRVRAMVAQAIDDELDRLIGKGQ